MRIEGNMVGMARLELTTPRSQNECATNCATSRLLDMQISRFVQVLYIFLESFSRTLIKDVYRPTYYVG